MNQQISSLRSLKLNILEIPKYKDNYYSVI